MSLKRLFILLGATLMGAVVLVACGGTPAQPTEEEAAQVELVIPFEEAFLASGHTDETAEAFVHWDEDGAVPVACAKCHTSAGYQEFVSTGKVAADITAPAGTLGCDTCHNAAAMALTSVTFPSGQVVETSADGEARCMICHQGRESKVSVDKQIEETFKVTDVDAVVQPIKDAEGKDVRFGFRNVHYFAAGATLYGSQAGMGYEYPEKTYDPKFRHVEDFDTCVECHDQHATELRIEACAQCHQDVKTVDDLKNNRDEGSLKDYNGNGDVEEGIYYELEGLQDILFSSIQAYANEVSGVGLVYDPVAYPYWFADADGDGAPDQKDGENVAYSSWTARLLKGAYNYQVSAKDPGAYAHNAKYIIELLYDSIEDLNGEISTPVDMTALARNDAGHFAGNTEAFRHWDEEGEVPAQCAKCHSAEGLPQYLESGGTVVVTNRGAVTTGVSAQPPANGFMCTTCHDSANWPERYGVVNVPFPSGVSLTFSTEKDADGNLIPVDSNLCIECHQGRESTVTVNNHLGEKPEDTPDPKISFRNIHYFAAGATLFGDAAKGAYQYDGQTYLGQNTEHPLNKCTDCHEVHELGVKVDACTGCHADVSGPEDLEKIRFASNTTDWNGNGDVTEGVDSEIDGFGVALYAAIQAYAEKSGTPITYDPYAYPYWFVDMDKDGKADVGDKGPIGYNAWTPRLLKGAYNYQYIQKDPGAFTHNPKYVMQFLYDSIKDLAGDVSGFTRP